MDWLRKYFTPPEKFAKTFTITASPWVTDMHWSQRPDRRRFNNLSLRKKNLKRRLWREERKCLNEGARHICEAEDNLFLDMLKGQSK